MTAFARQEEQTEQGELTCEVRSEPSLLGTFIAP